MTKCYHDMSSNGVEVWVSNVCLQHHFISSFLLYALVLSGWLCNNFLQLAKDTVVNVWKTNPDATKEMSKVTKAGYQAILSAHWYLNRVEYGENWQNYYKIDPQVSQLTAPPTPFQTC